MRSRCLVSSLLRQVDMTVYLFCLLASTWDTVNRTLCAFVNNTQWRKICWTGKSTSNLCPRHVWPILNLWIIISFRGKQNKLITFTLGCDGWVSRFIMLCCCSLQGSSIPEGISTRGMTELHIVANQTSKLNSQLNENVSECQMHIILTVLWLRRQLIPTGMRTTYSFLY